MINMEYQRFEKLLNDLCVAFDKPISDDRKRVFWDALRAYPLSSVERAIKDRIAAGGKFPSAGDLAPRQSVDNSPADTYRAPKPEHCEPVHAHAQKCMLSFLWHRGAATEEALKRMIAEKNRIVDTYKSIMVNDSTVTGEDIKNSLFKVWSKVWVARPQEGSQS